MKVTGDTELNAYSIAATTPLSFGLHSSTRETQAPQKRKARILVVDDDPGLLRLLTIRLRAENYEVEAVESAAAALSACVRFRPDLVITDLRMDQMDGIGLLKELQSRWPGLRVIILTAHGTIPGAMRSQKGLFETADGGTLLLDEVGDMPMRLQVKLLRVLQENQIRPVGAAETVPINVRIISSTHRDLHELMVGGQFREDLYYRLNVVHIEMPALGKRREDIPLLVAHFLEQIAKESGQRKIYAPEAVELLATAEWPGNVRQLYNVVRQNVALSHGAIITAELVQQSLGGNPTRLPSFDEARDEFTRNYMSQILQITGGNVSQAARRARRNRTDFYKLLSRHQLLPDDFKKS